MKKSALIFLSLLLIINNLFAQESRGLQLKVKELDPYATVGKQYAVFIAIDKYQKWPPLKNPVKDATELKNILGDKYYIDEYIELYDEKATKNGIYDLFNDLIDKIKPEDSLFIFYAGHGHLDPKLTKKGSWIPCDGGVEERYQDNWIPNDLLRGMIDNIKSKHILLVSDSCFSGDMLSATRGMVDPNKMDYFKVAFNKVSRQILTSGASETVSDNSIFAKALKTYLEYNNKPIIDPLNIFDNIRMEASKYSTPMLGSLPDSKHQEGGSFLFFLREDKMVLDNYKKRLDKINQSSTDINEILKEVVEVTAIIGESKRDNFEEITVKGGTVKAVLYGNITKMIEELNENDKNILNLADDYNKLQFIGGKIKEYNNADFDFNLIKKNKALENSI